MGNSQSGSSESGCPAKHTTPSAAPAEKQSGCPIDHKNVSASADTCPVDHKNLPADSPYIYNVYGETINPKNMMPTANQMPHSTQVVPLPTDRQVSNIPKGGTENTWVYPSPQMFFNSLKRKGKGDDIDESSMESVVAVHNDMNERTWMALLDWEKQYEGTCVAPKLLHFKGRPHDLTPKAQIKSWLGYGLPFDRHDWVVDRCGKEVRYVIDYYADDNKLGRPDCITFDVRPALDSVEAGVDRVKMSLREAGILN